jgi:hypothetical protein
MCCYNGASAMPHATMRTLKFKRFSSTNSYHLASLGSLVRGPKKARGNLSYSTHTESQTESWAAVTYETNPDFPRALLLRSYDRKTPWFCFLPIKTLGVLIMGRGAMRARRKARATFRILMLLPRACREPEFWRVAAIPFDPRQVHSNVPSRSEGHYT